MTPPTSKRAKPTPGGPWRTVNETLSCGYSVRSDSDDVIAWFPYRKSFARIRDEARANAELFVAALEAQEKERKP
jgi:hypothetical protein